MIKEFESITRHDIARISHFQLEIIKKLVNYASDSKLRIAVLHHHLLPVDAREEFKTFSDISNLGALRQVFRKHKISIVIHGHKHKNAIYYDHIYPDDDPTNLPHRVLVISGGSFGPSGEHADEPLRLIEIDDFPHAPTCIVKTIPTAQPGRDFKTLPSRPYPLWEHDAHELGPVVVHGTSIDEVYTRVMKMAEASSERPLICAIDNLPDNEEALYPEMYPSHGDLSPSQMRQWFAETVRWWQLPSSKTEARIPYIHGSRLRRFSGYFNQIDYLAQHLGHEKKPSSKAIAFVIDPVRDLRGDKPFASFCLVQFCQRSEDRLDCIAYYRTQEFALWWPVNVAELRSLQKELAARTMLKPGQIVTITPYPRLMSQRVRQPSKVAVPLIDQWLDNHPIRIAQIALALTSQSGKEGFEYWERCLNDLEQATSSYHPDGTPLAVEGLELLRNLLSAAKAPDELCDIIGDIINSNSNCPYNMEQLYFTSWANSVRRNINKLREITETLRNEEGIHHAASVGS